MSNMSRSNTLCNFKAANILLMNIVDHLPQKPLLDTYVAEKYLNACKMARDCGKLLYVTKIIYLVTVRLRTNNRLAG
jgi:hypothetical protein